MLIRDYLPRAEEKDDLWFRGKVAELSNFQAKAQTGKFDLPDENSETLTSLSWSSSGEHDNPGADRGAGERRQEAFERHM